MSDERSRKKLIQAGYKEIDIIVLSALDWSIGVDGWPL